jgi:hypothetical protein
MSDITPFNGFTTPDGVIHPTEEAARMHLMKDAFRGAADAFIAAKGIVNKTQATRVRNTIIEYLAFEESQAAA